eukprot:5247144-Alexandrium_andersonii.AAC.1
MPGGRAAVRRPQETFGPRPELRLATVSGDARVTPDAGAASRLCRAWATPGERPARHGSASARFPQLAPARRDSRRGPGPGPRAEGQA